MLQVTTKQQWLRPEVIEAKAQALLAAYEQQFGKVSGPPIPIEHLIEAHLELTIDWDDIEEEPGQVILAYIDPATRTICMNARRRAHFEQFIGSETFTFGHEVGHWGLHVVNAVGEQLSLFEASQPKKFLCRGNQKDGLEWQANQYSAALVMPADMIRMYAEKTDLCTWKNLYPLKELFGVTISAFVNRLQNLKLIYKAPDGTLYPSQEAYVGQDGLL